MTSRLRTHLTFANTVSVLALFIALGGGAYAVTLKKNSVGPKQLKTNAVTGVDANEATFGKVPSAVVADTAGTAGNGVRAYAQVQAHGGTKGSPCTTGPGNNECNIFRSRGVTKVTKPQTGTYCVFVPGANPVSAANGPSPAVTLDVATTDITPVLGTPVNLDAWIDLSDTAPCTSSGAYTVFTLDNAEPANVDTIGFTIVIP
jgi:hypothetical protein